MWQHAQPAPVDVRRLTVRRRPTIWLLFAAMALLLAGYITWLAVRPASTSSTIIDGWGVDAFELLAGVLCILGGRRRAGGSAVSVVLGVAVISWALGDTATTIESLGGVTPSSPSAADIFWLGFFPLSYVAVMLLVRGETRRLSSPNWLDGAVAGLGAGAVCAAFVFSRIVQTTHDSTWAAAVNLAYPVGDVLLLLLVIGGSAAMSGRRKTPWLLIATGMTINVAGDTCALLETSVGATHLGVIVNSIAWPTSSLLMSMAMWVSPGRPDPLAARRPPGFMLPGLAASAGLAILFARTVASINHVATALATATLVLVVFRTWLSVRDLRAQSQARHQQSITDHLTGLGNRRGLFAALEALLTEPGAAPPRLAFLFIDLNGFKRVNDAFGHPVGDEILQQVAARFARALRRHDVLVRLGGDEFAALLVDAGAEEATHIATRLSASLTEPFALAAVSVGIGASIGIALGPDDATHTDALIGCADAAMYRAKRDGIPHARFDHALDASADKLALAEDLRSAIDRDELVLHYQPQLALCADRVTAVEALVRWRHPERGLIAPATFLPLASEAGMMGRLTTWVLGEALRQCARWRRDGRDLRVSVNVCAGDLADPEFPSTVAGLLADAGLDARALVLEITETSIIEDFDRAQHAVQRLAALGVDVAIDDFGSGFTSLAYVSDLRVAELKLDRRFITPLVDGGDGRESALVAALIDLGHALGLRVVAEGIEHMVTIGVLRELGCDVAQGYAIGRPVPAGELDLAGAPADQAAFVSPPSMI